MTQSVVCYNFSVIDSGKLCFNRIRKWIFVKHLIKYQKTSTSYRPRYCKELFQVLEMVCRLNPEKKVLEIGPGTGQTTEPILKTGCNYTAIELGENFTSFMQNKFGRYPNFHIVNADFEAMFMTRSDETRANPSLRREIDIQF